MSKILTDLMSCFVGDLMNRPTYSKAGARCHRRLYLYRQ